MSRLSRFTQKLFGSTAGTNEMSEFGSLAAGTPARYTGATITPTIIQTLGNFLGGWKSAQVGSGNPAIEDMNSLCYLYAYQLSYMLQNGVPEWDSGTTYFIGQVVTDGTGKAYSSLVDNNTNHVVTDLTKWTPWINILGAQRTRTVAQSAPLGGIALSPTSGTFTTAGGFPTDVTGVNCTLVTSGNPVIIGCTPDGDPVQPGRFQANTGGVSGSLWRWGFFNNTSSVLDAAAFLGIDQSPNQAYTGFYYWAPSSAYAMIFPAAGTHQWKMQVGNNSGNTLFVGYMKMFAYELF